MVENDAAQQAQHAYLPFAQLLDEGNNPSNPRRPCRPLWQVFSLTACLLVAGYIPC